MKDHAAMSVSASKATKGTLQQQARAWVLHIKSGKASTGDVQALRQWCALSSGHAQAFKEARRAWEDMGQVGLAYRARHPQQAQRPTSILDRRMFLGTAFSAVGASAVAAMVYPPLGLWPSVFELGADYRTATGEQQIGRAHV